MLRLLLFLVFSLPAAADVTCAPIFGDHMVLQRQTKVAIWGRGEPGEHVHVQGSWSEEGRETVTGSDGRWSLRLPTPEAGGPYTLRVEGNNALAFEDVLIGEVWICSGQSNMEFPLRAVRNGEQELAAANDPRLRIFDVGRSIAMQPKSELSGNWAAVTPETASSFSAVGYFFGRSIEQHLGVPVGLIGSNWGGTVAESWTSREGLAPVQEFQPALAAIDAHSEEGGPSLLERQTRWWKRWFEADLGNREGWMQAEFDDQEWPRVTLPGTFQDFGQGGFDGSYWFRRRITIPTDWAGKELMLELGPIDDMDQVFLNGERVAGTTIFGQYRTPRRYAIPAERVRAGEENLLVVCVVDTGGVGAIGGGTELRLHPKEEEGGIDLGGRWRAKPGSPIGDFEAFPTQDWFHANYPTALFNGMIAPLIPYTLRGVLWYQGESNRGRAQQYARLFPAMITDWRRHWGQGDFPFYFVRLAPFGYGGDRGELAAIREAQSAALDLPNTGMAVTLDIGNPSDIHPRNKQDVGDRLARIALARDYGVDLEYWGPTYRALLVVGDTVRCHFDHAQGLHAEGRPAHFTVAGEDHVFHPAQARIEGETVLVRSDEVPSPVAVRYCWGATDQGNLFNGDGLPAPSFRSDDWDPLEGNR